MAPVEIEHLTKIYPNGTEAVRDVDLDIAEGEFMVLVGPSGCGKTTTLRMVAGLEDITDGTVRVGGHVVNELSPSERDMAMVFQNYALYPHMTVADNIGFALKLRKRPKDEIRAKVEEAARVLGLTDHLRRKPAQLSGGQRQRVAMGRAIVREPAVFLMDEPLSNLDAKLRVQMRAEVARIQHHLGVATLYVTHDQTEAMTMGDRVAVFSQGTLQQCDPPQVLYDSPTNLFVAAFIGSPAMNLYRAVLEPGGASLRIGEQSIELAPQLRQDRHLQHFQEHDLVVGIRPEDLTEVTGRDGTDGAQLLATVELVESLGSEKLVHFRLDAEAVEPPSDAATTDSSESMGVGEIASASPVNGVARVTPASQLKASEQVRLRVSTERLHLFDPGTGNAILGPGRLEEHTPARPSGPPPTDTLGGDPPQTAGG